jgi:hypothetical protein
MKIENVNIAVELIKHYENITRFIRSMQDKKTVEIHFPAIGSTANTVKIQLPYAQVENLLNEEKTGLARSLEAIGVEV